MPLPFGQAWVKIVDSVMMSAKTNQRIGNKSYPIPFIVGEFNKAHIGSVAIFLWTNIWEIQLAHGSMVNAHG